MRRLLIFVPIVVLATLALLVWKQQQRGPFFVSGFIEAEQIRVGSRVGGRVLAVNFDEGAAVRKDAAIFALDPFDLQERLAEARATRAARAAELDKLRQGPRGEEIEQARAARDQADANLAKLLAGSRALEIAIAEDQLARAEVELTKANQDYARVKKLFDGGQAAEEEMNEVTRGQGVGTAVAAQARDQLALLREGARVEDIAAARAQLAEATQRLALLEAGTRKEDLAAGAAQLDAAEAAVRAMEQQVGELVVYAPRDMLIEALDLDPGDLVAPSAPVVSLIDPNDLWVRAYVPENRLNVKLGQKVRVRVDAFPGRTFAGHVTYVARQAEFTPSNVQTIEERSQQVFRIKVTLDEGLEVLRAGMAADVYLDASP